ncbi:hypothetical protein QQM79_17665 [Marinobacteraceae bacterium S3BR75-40.1]
MFKAKRKQKRVMAQNAVIARDKQLILANQYLQSALNSQRPGVGNDKPHEIIVSLTTFDKRIANVYLTIESIFQQALRPDRVILWISEEDFGENDIPEILRLQQQRGLEIGFMPKDIGPYGKFYYTLERHPESLIVTVDDDHIYPHDMVDMLYRTWLEDPHTIPCHRAHKISFDSQGQLLPYKEWQKSTTDTKPSLLTFPTGIGGVLYFPGCFDEAILDKELFLSLCPHADDVWLKAMSLKKGTPCKRVREYRNFGTRFLTVHDSQVAALKKGNKRGASNNDTKLKAVWDHFNLWDKMPKG